MYFYASEEPDLPPLNPPPEKPPLEGHAEKDVYRDSDSSEGGLGTFLKDLAQAFLYGAATAARTVGNMDLGTPLKTALQQDEAQSRRPVHIPLQPPLETQNVIPFQGSSQATAIRRQQFAEQEAARRQARYEREMAKIQESIHNKAAAYAKQHGLEQFIRPITSRMQQPTDLDTIQTAHTGLSLNQVLNPNAGQRAWINETLPVIPRIQGSQNPLTRQEYRQQQNELALQQAQLDALLAQERHARAEHQRAQRQIHASFRTPGLDKLFIPELPNSFHKGINITELVVKGHVPTDDQLKQLLHTMELEKFSAKTAPEIVKAEDNERWIKNKLAQNMVSGPDALINRDDYVIIGDQAYGNFEAFEKALEDIEYFERTGKHIPPLSYPTDPNLPRSAYPDVTNDVKKKMDQAVLEIKEKRISSLNLISRGLYLKDIFNNNKKYDMQVGHDLPGQILVRKNGKPQKDPESPAHVLTIDQYAIFNGQVRRAGYISNYAFGYAAAAADLPDWFITNGAHFGALLDDVSHLRFRGLFPDNPKDQRAMLDGSSAYDRELK